MLCVQENTQGKYVVHCMHCALTIDARLESFHVLQQYTVDELVQVIDRCVLVNPPTAGGTASAMGGAAVGAGAGRGSGAAQAAQQQQMLIC